MTKGSGRLKLMLSNYDMYLLLVPGLIFLLLFKYAPMYGIVIAFQDFNIFDGFSGSKWVGLDQFEKLIHSEEFYQVFINTLLISLYKIVLLFPIPIIIALFLNEVRKVFFKKTIQTIIFLPHFLSWVIISGLFINILSPTGGLVNNVIQWFGGEPISFFLDNQFFRSVVVFTAGWKESGWNAIIFIAAIAGIEQEQYEAASIDGAGRIRQMLYITLPGILPTIILILILRLGYLLEAGTEQILTMYNSVVYASGDVIGTFVYRQGLGQQDYSFSTAVGLFNSVVGFILIVAGNELSKKLIKRSIW
ncbi:MULTISPECIES: sugar ABC transporter permease [Paenibacillus]|uniref:ABC transporter permease subunit n=3 Tax=Paenibacillus TaxID=44249 RepID=A0ABU3RGH2_9BACL|nr:MULTISPECIES: ABC transporter permease subunit [Paenibacillus]MBA2940468.1 sugar ABC transporter permease [Paenibacillus sp. CGMCC 1.16610]MCY9660921.1 ABC transporter permease subunit [Paenibacillus anseongense]MDU0203124.1 ABC transporter permease subunit [Paenibacillus sp. PFR10]MEB4792281.1 ABC transporter permease subunit [Paenibacillus chondroitinus]MEC0267208.1 ABC transporter permease subunit [Paenibacillus anseongense]